MFLLTFVQRNKSNMFFNKIKEKVHYFFVKKNKDSHRYKGTKKEGTNQSILVIIDDFDTKDLVEKELRHFFKEKISLDIITFKEEVKDKKERLEYITPYDFGWKGGISDKLKETVLTKKYDLLINYCKVDYVYIKTLLLYCHFDFAISYAHLNNEPYDIQINCDTDNVKLFTDEVKKYLKILNKI